MSISNKFFSAVSLIAVAGSVVLIPSTTANAQAVGTITAGAGSNLVFCGTAGTTSSVVAGVTTLAAASQNLGSSASFSAGSTVRVAYNSKTAGAWAGSARGLDDNNRCIDNNVALLTFTPAIDFARHTTRFSIRLNNTGVIELTDVQVSNTAPTVNTNLICIAPNGRARFSVNDAEGDTVTTLVNSASNGIVSSGSTYIDYTPNTDYVGMETLNIELQDNVMSSLSSDVDLTGVGATFTGFTGSVLPNVSSGTTPVRQTLTVQVSNSCPSSSSSSSVSSVSSSSVSSVSSSSVSSVSSVSSSSSVAAVVYIEVPVSGKGTTIRTGASN